MLFLRGKELNQVRGQFYRSSLVQRPRIDRHMRARTQRSGTIVCKRMQRNTCTPIYTYTCNRTLTYFKHTRAYASTHKCPPHIIIHNTSPFLYSLAGWWTMSHSLPPLVPLWILAMFPSLQRRSLTVQDNPPQVYFQAVFPSEFASSLSSSSTLICLQHFFRQFFWTHLRVCPAHVILLCTIVLHGCFFSNLLSQFRHLRSTVALICIFSWLSRFLRPPTSPSASANANAPNTQIPAVQQQLLTLLYSSFQLFLQLSVTHNTFSPLPCCRSCLCSPLYFPMTPPPSHTVPPSTQSFTYVIVVHQ